MGAHPTIFQSTLLGWCTRIADVACDSFWVPDLPALYGLHSPIDDLTNRTRPKVPRRARFRGTKAGISELRSLKVESVCGTTCKPRCTRLSSEGSSCLNRFMRPS